MTDVHTTVLGRGRRLVIVAVIVAAVGLMGLLQARPADAQSDFTFIYRDLRITSMEFKDLGYPFFSPGTYLVFKVKNSGNLAAGQFTIRVYNGNGFVVQSYAVSGLSAGDTKTFYHKLPPFGCGDPHTRKVRLDTGNTVPELNENNNSDSATHVYPPC
jgi:hypothetical protein